MSESTANRGACDWMTLCPECGHEVGVSAGPDRTCRYRGAGGYLVPDGMTFPECKHCGAQWMTDSQVDELDAVLEEQRARIHHEKAAVR